MEIQLISLILKCQRFHIFLCSSLLVHSASLPGVAVAGVQEAQHREELHQPQEDVQVPTKYF